MKEKKVDTSYFFDTYAFVEIYKANPNFSTYSKGVGVFTNRLNLMELSFFLRREKRENEINEMFKQLSRFNIDYDDSILIEAANMKFEHKNKDLSYVDCIGYLIALRHKLKFLTGDEKFKGMPNVEFVK